ncbi:class II aldolase/adducin family protein [Pelolinea submarina]|uniref:L-fuculose-phosphate aldolase n=1 Tax=Pelolinea submarina TaxID=913107 RepID=A0A3E0AJ68_9CHLR|nr:class II aldolase/adducin family protein [Pelolinea submarina]REG11697.1 L-fuculose-phosphate aldolase [Pelolinea submarina]
MKNISERLTIPQQIVYVAKFMFERELTDIAGGNISAKVGDVIYMTPTLAGNQYHWDIGPEDVVSGSLSEIEQFKKHSRFSREGLSHLAIYQAFPYVGAVIHAHPKYVLPFTASSKPIPAVLNSSKSFGTLQYHTEAPSYSQEQADLIVEMFKDQEAGLKSKAGVVLMPRHGVILGSPDLITALDCLQRINTNAFAVMTQKRID